LWILSLYALHRLTFDFGGLILGCCLCVVKKQKNDKKRKNEKTKKKKNGTTGVALVGCVLVLGVGVFCGF